ncbi:sialate O-acetylesterase [Prosthecobacter vanneervenii]|uniref:Sialate O-acetylesterase n=1 Tax=Prosthecobacter vanneervenii TaxID=48466 RepID=A0A7W7Y7T3_9BACT|nr:sialate O-acetylesterase [Prosthecobacter vanneervenii]MBB5031181.1 sialate O-acetylesterase [Prosthecobacter vanneervenii]
MKLSFACVSLLLFASALQAEVKLSKVFTPHMVLQRGMAVPVWGTAAPGEKVTVSFAGQSKTATADDKGAWSVKLEALQASTEPRTLIIGDKKIEDVLVGDVWVGSGQSNMDMTVSSYTKDDPVLDAASKQSYPHLRLLRKDPTATWEQATPETNVKFSALLFSFGFPLQKELNVPVGLMVGAVGGTPSGFWLSEDMYRSDAACAEAVKAFAPTYKYDELMAKYTVEKAKWDVELAAWKKQAEAAKKEGKEPTRPPRGPQPVGKAGEPNFGKVGQLFEQFIRPYVGYGIKGVLWDQGESRTNIAGVDQVTLMGALIGGWRKAWGQGDFPWLYVEKPSGGGCAYDYTQPMNRLAEKFAPLPKTIPNNPDKEYSHVAFEQIMKYKNTHMVISSDLGNGIHPPNKSGYGARAVQVALAVAYDRGNEYLGPQLASHSISGGKVTLKFKHSGKGLAFKNGDKLQGFSIAGADKKFVWADAVIEGDSVIVSSKDVPQPAAVRYAWSNAFQWANLFNQDGLPAQPFRTDAW